MVQAPQDDAGEVDGFSEVAHQRALNTKNIPPRGDKVNMSLSVLFCISLSVPLHSFSGLFHLVSGLSFNFLPNLLLRHVSHRHPHLQLYNNLVTLMEN